MQRIFFFLGAVALRTIFESALWVGQALPRVLHLLFSLTQWVNIRSVAAPLVFLLCLTGLCKSLDFCGHTTGMSELSLAFMRITLVAMLACGPAR